jgi:hypothetical protein
MKFALFFALPACLLYGCSSSRSGDHTEPHFAALPSPPPEVQPRREALPARTASQDFPVYTPRTEIRGPRADSDFPIVDTPDYKGAIVPAEEAARHRYLSKRYKDFWTPTPEEVGKAEARISAFMASCSGPQASEIRRKLNRFRRQYVGYTTDGEKRMLCSFLPGVREGGDPFVGLRWSFIKVYDGGPSFWQIEYRVERDECDNFHVDGGIF